jgi:hypothetical protein
VRNLRYGYVFILGIYTMLTHPIALGAAPVAQAQVLEAPAVSAREAIAANVASFAFRDQARWDELHALFTQDATISISWHNGSAQEFVERSKKLVAAGAPPTKHLLSAPRITVCGARALSETDVAILIRSKVGPIELDVTSYLRFYDRFELGADKVWRVRSRTGVYEKDRIDPVGPSFLFWAVYPFLPLGSYPRELRHLAFGLKKAGLELLPTVVISSSEAEKTLKQQAMQWSGCAPNMGQP